MEVVSRTVEDISFATNVVPGTPEVVRISVDDISNRLEVVSRIAEDDFVSTDVVSGVPEVVSRTIDDFSMLVKIVSVTVTVNSIPGGDV